ncbi:MAG: hypothetical protein R8N24_04615 [Alphaproteobacteria bacterium]|jgi:hypothetical protein|nr:hypothetical protein [Alphaproteobacteria bacterium]
MKAKIRATAQKLLNLYRQEHVIVGGWPVLNKIFINDATDDVIEELRGMPTGKNLIQHIENLRSGKTAMNTIERELLPYGGMMNETVSTTNLPDTQWQELQFIINNFVPTQAGLDNFLSSNIVRSFGEQWPVAIKSILASHPDMMDKWHEINQTYNAYRLWDSANEIISKPLSDRTRADIQADMPEYETYLPMFGDAGNELLGKLRTFISTIN